MRPAVKENAISYNKDTAAYVDPQAWFNCRATVSPLAEPVNMPSCGWTNNTHTVVTAVPFRTPSSATAVPGSAQRTGVLTTPPRTRLYMRIAGPVRLTLRRQVIEFCAGDGILPNRSR